MPALAGALARPAPNRFAAVEVLAAVAVDVGRLYKTKLLLSGLLLKITLRNEGQRTENKPSRWRHGVDFK